MPANAMVDPPPHSRARPLPQVMYPGKKITPESREHPGPRASNIHCA